MAACDCNGKENERGISHLFRLSVQDTPEGVRGNLRAMQRVALVWHGDREARDSADLSNSRFAAISQALRDVGLVPEPAVYNDDFADEVRAQLLKVDGVQVWVNPITSDRHDRSKLDPLLKEVEESGVFVSAHPDVILRMGTKQVLFDTKNMSWGSDVHVYGSVDELRAELSARLPLGKARVLKQYRGHSGGGIWKVSLAKPATCAVSPDTPVLLRHAERGSVEKSVPFEDAIQQFADYFKGDGRMIDQEYQETLKDGMVRCYLVEDKVAGFGHQEINALFPSPSGAPPEDAPQPGPRLYSGPDDPRFQDVRKRMEGEWLGELFTCLSLKREQLPLLWDADFFYGAKPGDYVLGEINVSSVAPFPDSIMAPFAAAMQRRLGVKVA